jgi:phage baseplate assembly protein gpV
MPKVHLLQPHDAVPESGRFVLVLRRLGEDAPDVVITEIILSENTEPPEMSVALRPDGTSMDFDEAVAAATAEAERRGIPAVYAVDRTSGPREREVLAHGGDHTVAMDKLDDTAAGETGSDMRDRPLDAGYNVTPHR